MSKRIQIEITNKCNKTCFYCPIEKMSHKNMEWDIFKKIIDEQKESRIFFLQGTGEPFLNPLIYDMAKYIKEKDYKNRVKTITNGTIKINKEKVVYFDEIIFSVDDFNSDKDVKHLKDSIENILEIKELIKISLLCVDFKQDKKEVISFSRKHKIKLNIQGLQESKNYQTKYYTEEKEVKFFECPYIKEDKLDYFYVSGKKSPCSFILFEENSLSREEIKDIFNKKEIPKCCEGCEILTKGERFFYEKNIKNDIKMFIKKITKK